MHQKRTSLNFGVLACVGSFWCGSAFYAGLMLALRPPQRQRQRRTNEPRPYNSVTSLMPTHAHSNTLRYTVCCRRWVRARIFGVHRAHSLRPRNMRWENKRTRMRAHTHTERCRFHTNPEPKPAKIYAQKLNIYVEMNVIYLYRQAERQPWQPRWRRLRRQRSNTLVYSWTRWCGAAAAAATAAAAAAAFAAVPLLSTRTRAFDTLVICVRAYEHNIETLSSSEAVAEAAAAAAAGFVCVHAHRWRWQK